ncbi:MAG: gliding motility lipoprotein GldH [Bacteroidales bacterium]|jgi:gliding motility-associated lipoprotein GldH|nr:gliding motility lipoprotein GldH [Bacteroidales bacterium]
MKKKIFASWICFLLLVCSCDNSQYLFSGNTVIENEVWHVDNQIPFRFTVTDTQQIYKIGFNIRYTNAYPVQNIYIFLHTVFPNGMKAHDTIDINLFSPEGEPLGKRGKTIELLEYFSRVQFPQTGQYTMSLEQAMRTDSLLGMVSVGLYIAKPKKTEHNDKQKKNR